MVKFYNMVKLQCMNILNCVPWFHIPVQHGQITKHEYIELGSTVPHSLIPGSLIDINWNVGELHNKLC